MSDAVIGIPTSDATRATPTHERAPARHRGVWYARLQYLAGLALAGVLFWSAAAHLANPYHFLASVYEYQLVGQTAGTWIATLVPFVQLVVAACLVTRVALPGALLTASVMFLAFTSAQGIALARGLEINCGCFGPGGGIQVGAASLATSGALCLLAGVAYALSWKVRSAESATA
jgi:hypothetical protein